MQSNEQKTLRTKCKTQSMVVGTRTNCSSDNIEETNYNHTHTLLLLQSNRPVE